MDADTEVGQKNRPPVFNQTQASMTDSGVTTTLNFTYDGFNRLKKVSDNTGEAVYTYNADGLRSSKRSDGVFEQYVYDNGQLVLKLAKPATELASVSIPASGSVEFPLDTRLRKLYYVEVNGKIYRARAELDPSIYSVFGGPSMANGEDDGIREPVPGGSEDGSQATFWDFIALEAGDVIIRGVDGEKTATATGPAGRQVTVYDGDPRSTTIAYVRGLNLIASVENGTPTYYHYDAHGDVVQLTDSTGVVIKDYIYDAFGVEQNASEDDTNPFRYCGEQYDFETGNYYLRARYYTPGTGSFTQEDPAMDGLNWYTYCAGNPIRYVDRSGLDPDKLFDTLDEAAIKAKRYGS